MKNPHISQKFLVGLWRGEKEEHNCIYVTFGSSIVCAQGQGGLNLF